MSTKKKLNWKGVESITTDTYYDICQGYYDSEIEDNETKNKLKEAVAVIESLVAYLEKEGLIG